MRARNINGRRDDPNASFISQVLGYPETPHGLIPRSFIADILREGVEELHGLASFHVPIVVRVRALADESRWDEFCMAEGATTINENGFVTVCYAEACDPEVFDLTGA